MSPLPLLFALPLPLIFTLSEDGRWMGEMGDNGDDEECVRENVRKSERATVKTSQCMS